MERQFPRLTVHLSHLRENMEHVISQCAAAGIQVCGVIKGCEALPAVAQLYRDCGAVELGTSRIEHILRCREAGVPGPYLLLRIPMRSELPELVRWCETSLQSEAAILDALEEECRRQNTTHRVIVMADLGDLREGFWNQEEMLNVCIHVERDLPHVHLAGVGVNLGCYGSIQPTASKMLALLNIAQQVEQHIGRKLEVISGGASSSYTLVHWGTMPQGINHLRLGETVLLAHDLPFVWDIANMGLRQDTFLLKGEVIEIKNKPSYPEGQIVIDAFGRKPTYIDRGFRKRCIVGLGRADVGPIEDLIPLEDGILVLGGSSDHCILDIEEYPHTLEIGDIVEFELSYANMLYATGRNDLPIDIIET